MFRCLLFVEQNRQNQLVVWWKVVASVLLRISATIPKANSHLRSSEGRFLIKLAETSEFLSVYGVFLHFWVIRIGFSGVIVILLLSEAVLLVVCPQITKSLL